MYPKRESPALKAVCRNEQSSDRRPFGSVSQAHVTWCKAAYLCGDRIGSVCLSTDGEIILAFIYYLGNSNALYRFLLVHTGGRAKKPKTFMVNCLKPFIYFQTSNILEDLETLRLFARVIPEYSRSMEEADILENAFQIIFAFDEIVALGYRESVNLAQIRTFVEMDSHEEKVYQVSTNFTF